MDEYFIECLKAGGIVQPLAAGRLRRVMGAVAVVYFETIATLMQDFATSPYDINPSIT